MESISQKDSHIIAQKVRKDFYYPRANYKTSIFLCGAKINDQTKLRYKLSEMFTDWHSKHYYDLIYPEDIFDELLYTKNSKDLLSLEHILAKSIDVILIIPESPGSFAELGAFANDLNLRKKIICVMDKKYKKDKSFINQGPIKLIKKENKNSVIYIDSSNIIKSKGNIHSTIREVKKKQLIVLKDDKISLLQLEAFLIPLIYVLEPIKLETILQCLEPIIDDELNINSIGNTALNILTKKRQIELLHNGYKLTNLGKENYIGLKKLPNRIKIQNKNVDLDKLRLEILNLQYRKKKLSI